MTAVATPLGRGGRVGRGMRAFWAGISAVGGKELRGRMRGRRAFVVLTVYLLLLSVFAFGIYQYLKQEATLASRIFPQPGFVEHGFPESQPFTTGGSTGTALSAQIGHGIFSGLLLIETLLILVLAPAFTAGAISMEREKQTLDLLVTTPLSTLGMVLGKLISALGYVFLLILASIPLASLVFAFGGVGPEDLVRGYAILFSVAFGMGAIGLFISALVRRTQTATVITFVVVLALTLGSTALHQFLVITTQPSSTTGFVAVQARHQAPEALLWLNPVVADLDLVCTTVPSGYHETCTYLSTVTGKPYFGSTLNGTNCPPGARCAFPADGFGREVLEGGAVVIVGQDGFGGKPVPVNGPVPFEVPVAGVDRADIGLVAPDPAQPQVSLGFPRDTFWPRSAAAFIGLGTILVLLSTQLIAPSRRLRIPRLRRRGRAIEQTTATPASEVQA